ncbi:MAG: tetratricopeptide repeat protein [Deltaproteobacteria bacterium]|nr:tetratricopeptide repeat protein [Deltaproteobacteria bacterium]
MTPELATLLDHAIADQQQGRLKAAIDGYRTVLAALPESVEVRILLGTACAQHGASAEAITHLQQVVEREPQHGDAWLNLGIVYLQTGQRDEAGACLARAADCNPPSACAHQYLGSWHEHHGDLEAAAACYQRVLELDANPSAAALNLGVIHTQWGNFSRALEYFDRAAQDPAILAEVWNNRSAIFTAQGRIVEALAALEQATALKPDYREAWHNHLLNLNYHPSLSTASVAAQHRAWGQRQPVRTIVGTDHDRDPNRRLRIGYVSPDFRRHACVYFIEPFLQQHDRAVFELFCYANVAQPDATTTRLQSYGDFWRMIHRRATNEIAAQIVADRIDILVDLAGHTEGERLDVFAQQPAPLQVTYLGYPNTTGLATIDYRLVDALTDPDGAEPVHSERLWRLPHGFNCYLPPADAPAVGPLPARQRGHVVFGSLNNPAKLNDDVLQTWAAILHGVPTARLLLKSKALGDAATRAFVAQRFAAHGIAAARLELVGWSTDRRDQLSYYRELDLALDPFPYNGTTTTCEALWMGVPVIASWGDRHAARVSASLLTRVGLSECIANDRAGYVTTAVRLANDPDQLATWRAQLRDRMRASSLCDAAAFTRDLEAAYRGMWRAWCSGFPG